MILRISRDSHVGASFLGDMVFPLIPQQFGQTPLNCMQCIGELIYVFITTRPDIGPDVATLTNVYLILMNTTTLLANASTSISITCVPLESFTGVMNPTWISQRSTLIVALLPNMMIYFLGPDLADQDALCMD